MSKFQISYNERVGLYEAVSLGRLGVIPLQRPMQCRLGMTAREFDHFRPHDPEPAARPDPPELPSVLDLSSLTLESTARN